MESTLLCTLTIIVFTFSSHPATDAHRILGIFPHGARSHYSAFEPLMEALALRGHDVVVVSTFPRQTPLKHYTDIDLRVAVPVLTDEIPLDVYSFGEGDVSLTVAMLFKMGTEACEKVLSLPKIQNLKDEKFDLIIYEMFSTDCFLGLIHKFNAPYIAFSSSAIMPWHNDRFGNPDNPSYIPNHFLPHSDHMSYFERMKNLVCRETTKLLYHYFNHLPSTNITRTYLGESVPDLIDIAKNTSLVLINNHFTLNRPRPFVPAIIEVGGLHIRTPPKLPQDIQKFLDESKDGVIYFTFGSTVRASTFPLEKRRALLAAFSELPQRVLWKWDGDLPDKPSNIMTSKWFPQQAILNHPNVRVFITHGGLMGTIEAVSAGVPMVAVPLFGDQPLNVAALVQNGVAVKLDFRDLSNKKIIVGALRSVLENPQYAENSQRLAIAFNDRPLPPLDTAIYWTEYVIRHNGAPLLRVASVELPLYQYLLIDVIIPLIGVVLLVLFVLYLMVKKFVWFLVGLCSKKTTSSKLVGANSSKPKQKKG